MEALATARVAAGLHDARGSGTGTLRERILAARWSYLFMVPTLVLAFGFTFYPLVASWVISLLDWSGIDEERSWVGLGNYREALHDPYFWHAFGRTFAFALATVPATLLISLVVAIVLNDQALRLRPLFRTLFFLPVVTTTAIVGIVMSMLLNPFDGPVNTVLLNLGLVDAPIDFLGDRRLALWSVAGVYVWKWMGISMIYWLVALQTVPRELYEAAQVDGASGWQMHRRITVPMILPFAAIIALIGFVGALQTFPLVQAMTGGGPAQASELVEVSIYRLAFATNKTPRLGYASAVAVFFGVAVLVLATLQAWGVRRAAAMRQDTRRAGG